MSPRESENDSLTRVLRGAEPIAQAAGAARAFGEAQWLTEDELARLCIVVEELVANLYDHGGVTADQEVALTLASDHGGIRITILDAGTPFDPRGLAPRRETPERGGGAGIDIVRAWASFVDYQVTESGNRLELLLPVGLS